MINRKVDFAGHPHIEHFKFLKAHCRTTPKQCIPAPSTFHFRQGRKMVSKEVYPGPRPILRRRRRRLEEGDQAPSTTPAAAICSSTTPPGR